MTPQLSHEPLLTCYTILPDLEIYETLSEALCLMTLTGLLLLISGAMPLRSPLLNMPASDPDAGARKYAKGIIALTIFHHITTGILAGSHWILPTHNNAAMQVGVYGSGGLCALGIWTLLYGMDERNASAGNVGRRKAA